MEAFPLTLDERFSSAQLMEDIFCNSPQFEEGIITLQEVAGFRGVVQPIRERNSRTLARRRTLNLFQCESVICDEFPRSQRLADRGNPLFESKGFVNLACVDLDNLVPPASGRLNKLLCGEISCALDVGLLLHKFTSWA